MGVDHLQCRKTVSAFEQLPFQSWM